MQIGKSTGLDKISAKLSKQAGDTIIEKYSTYLSRLEIC